MSSEIAITGTWTGRVGTMSGNKGIPHFYSEKKTMVSLLYGRALATPQDTGLQKSAAPRISRLRLPHPTVGHRLTARCRNTVPPERPTAFESYSAGHHITWRGNHAICSTWFWWFSSQLPQLVWAGASQQGSFESQNLMLWPAVGLCSCKYARRILSRCNWSNPLAQQSRASTTLRLL